MRQNATSARFTAFSCSSTDMNTISALRRISTPTVPIAKSIAGQDEEVGDRRPHPATSGSGASSCAVMASSSACGDGPGLAAAPAPSPRSPRRSAGPTSPRTGRSTRVNSTLRERLRVAAGSFDGVEPGRRLRGEPDPRRARRRRSRRRPRGRARSRPAAARSAARVRSSPRSTPSSMITNRNSTMIAPAYTMICTALPLSRPRTLIRQRSKTWRDIRPIFQAKCASCHTSRNGQTPAAGLDLDADDRLIDDLIPRPIRGSHGRAARRIQQLRARSRRTAAGIGLR